MLFYPSNTDTGTFYGGSTDIDTDVQYPKLTKNLFMVHLFRATSTTQPDFWLDHYQEGIEYTKAKEYNYD